MKLDIFGTTYEISRRSRQEIINAGKTGVLKRLAVTYALGLSLLAVGVADWVSMRATSNPVEPVMQQYFQMALNSPPAHPELFCNGKTEEGRSVFYGNRTESGIFGHASVGKLLMGNPEITNGIVGYILTDRDNNLRVSTGDTVSVYHDNGSTSELRVTPANLEELTQKVEPLVNTSIAEIVWLKRENPGLCGYEQAMY